jgi:hypothetical protein
MNTPGEREKWEEFFSSLTEHELDGVALIRIIECSNGCIQHAFRDNDPRALPIEQTRDTMKFSMGLMKTLDLCLGGVTYDFSETTREGLRGIRELYVRGFKQGDSEAMDEFFQSSYACVDSLGVDRMRKAATIVKKELADVFPPHTVDWGFNYLSRLMESSPGNED